MDITELPVLVFVVIIKFLAIEETFVLKTGL